MCTVCIHLIAAVQVVAGVAEIKWKLEQQWDLLQVCLLSDAAVKARCEDAGGAEQSRAEQLVYRQKL